MDERTPTLGRFMRRAAFMGFIGGVVTIYLAVIGVVERFQPRALIIDVIGLGLAVPLIAMLVVYYQSGRTPRSWPPHHVDRRRLALMPVLSGVVGGIALVALVVVRSLDPIGFLPNLTERTIDILTLNAELPVSAAVVFAFSAGLGVVAAVLHLLDQRVRRVLLVAGLVVVVLSLTEPLLRVVLLQLAVTLGLSPLADLASFMYQSGGHGLTPPAAIISFVGALVVAAAAVLRGGAARARIAALPAGRQTGIQMGAIVVVALVLLLLPAIVGTFLSEVVGTVGLFLLMGLGLNIVVGYAGLLDLGYVAFFAVGAYAAALLTSPVSSLGLGLSLWVALPIVMLVAAIAGIAIGAPVLRLRGDYLAIVTLGFGEIVRILLLSDWLRPFFGGAQGVLQIPPPDLLGIRFFGPQQLYYPILISVIIGAVVAWSLANSRVGRAWNAMREDEDVAEATGINTTRYKLLAFAIGAVYGCIAGSFLAVKLGSVFPHNLNILVSITVLALIILGGMGSIRGVIVGAVVLVGLPELLREFGEYRLLIYGAVLVAMMVLRPEGLLPSATRKRELHEEEPEETQYLHQAGGDTGGPGIKGAPA